MALQLSSVLEQDHCCAYRLAWVVLTAPIPILRERLKQHSCADKELLRSKRKQPATLVLPKTHWTN